MFNRIIVPVDGSELAERAIPVAREMALATGTPIELLSVIDTSKLTPFASISLAIETTAMAEAMEAERIASTEYLQRKAAMLRSEGIKISTTMLEGDPAIAIVNHAQTGDHIVMASHGRSGFQRWVLGSVAGEVVRRSVVPVTVIKSSSQDARIDSIGNGSTVSAAIPV